MNVERDKRGFEGFAGSIVDEKEMGNEPDEEFDLWLSLSIGNVIITGRWEYCIKQSNKQKGVVPY